MANIDMFKRIRDQIKADPKTFNMGSWESNLSEEAQEDGDWDHEYYNPNTDNYEGVSASECGTTRCIAGWGIHFAASDLGIDANISLCHLLSEVAYRIGMEATDRIDYETVGAKVLGIEVGAAKGIFYSSDETGWDLVNQYANGEIS